MKKKIKRLGISGKKFDMNDLAQCITDAEGKRIQVNIAQIKEILSIIAMYTYVDSGIVAMLIQNGAKKFKKEFG